MVTPRPTMTLQRGCIRDTRGRKVTQLDPVSVHLLNQGCIIPAETSRSMADQILPGARGQRLIAVLCAAIIFLFIGRGIVACIMSAMIATMTSSKG